MFGSSWIPMARANCHDFPNRVWHLTHRCHQREFLFKCLWLLTLILSSLGCTVIHHSPETVRGDLAYQLFVAISEGDVETAQTLLAEGVNPNIVDSSGASPLHHAAADNDLEIARLLLSAGAKVDALTLGKTTPLMWAAHFGRTEAAQLLLENGADVNWRGSHEETPLIEAVLHEHYDTAQTLLAHGADVNAALVEGATALDIAVRSGDQNLIQLLRNAGAK